MPSRLTLLSRGPAPGAAARLDVAFAAIRREQGVREEFPAPVLAEAAASAADPRLPERDETALELVTIDPPGARDLDQAVHITREGAGYRVRYAIADVPAFVAAGGRVDAEARLRGQTVYCPDTRVPLHPTVVSEEAASLLPEQDRPAYLWDMVLGPGGEQVRAGVSRAMVRSRRRYDYEQVQRQVDAGEAEETLHLLREVGRLRVARESERGGAGLPMPSQEVEVSATGEYTLRLRPLLEAEDWNAQISLLTGMVAAAMMLDAGVGILRTMPPAEQRDLDRFRRQVRALGVDWPRALGYGDFLRGLDRTNPRHLAVIHDATSLFRGAGYTPFDGELPGQRLQAALGAPYAHVTAPLRRLVDRYGLAVCAALSAGKPVPDWARSALPQLPAVMSASDQRTRAVERACTDAVEAALLAHRVGDVFEAVVVDEAAQGEWVVQVTEPAVSARSTGEASLGDRVRVELVAADVVQHTVRFAVVQVVGTS